MRVVFVQKFVPVYRLPFFEKFREQLKDRGIDFLLIYGEPDPYEGSKVKMAYPEWGTRVNSRIVKLAGRFLYWQGVVRHLKKGDLVIVEQAAKLVDNYLLYALCRVGYIRMGYFGHGENFQSDDELAISGWIKKQMVTKVTHWFAYTELTRLSLIKQQVSESKITVVNNTLARPDDIPDHIDKRPGQLLYIGGLYTLKRMDLVIEGFLHAQKSMPSLTLQVVGSGPLQPMIEEMAAKHSGISYQGSLYGVDRHTMIGSSEAILMPGLVGLVAIDSFFFETPILSSNAGQHSPEVAYLEHENNALFEDDGGQAESYGDLILRFMTEEGLKASLKENCKQSATLYGIDNMVANFCDGVETVFASQK